MTDGAAHTVTGADLEVARMCLDLQERFGWDDPSAGYQVDDRWTSRTADFFLCRGVDLEAPTIVVKVLARERAPQPQAVHATLEELAAIHRDSTAVTARPPRALGWMSEPAALAMEYLPGERGSDLVRRCLSAREVDVLEPFARVCGTTLGAWHAWWGIGGTHGAKNEAHRRLASAARRQGIRLATVLRDDAQLPLVRRFRDFGAYNFQRSPDGETMILDPPSASAGRDFACRDVAWFLSSIASLASRSTAADESDPEEVLSGYAAVRDVFVRSFVVGYAAGAGFQPSTEELRAAALLEAAFLLARSARKVRTDRISAAKLARLAWEARRRAIR